MSCLGGLVFFLFFCLFFPPSGGGFLLGAVCTTFTSEVFVGAVVVLVEVFVVELGVLDCVEDDLSGVDFTDPMILSLCA